MTMKYDVVIIGGGAAGLAAAASFSKDAADSEKRSVCILEKNDSLGRKLQATGGGRCNLTNAACPGKDDTIRFFKELGLETWCDPEGRYYPYSNRASDVTKTLVDALDADIRCGFEVKVVSRIKEDENDQRYFMVTGMSEQGMEMIFADKVLFAMGGKAGPQFGTTGDGYTLARTMGHKVTRVFPILTGVECAADGVDFSALKGIRAHGTVILSKDGKQIVRDTGEIQFTEDGISGICVFNLTPHIKADQGERFDAALRRYTVTLDLAPDFTEEELSTRDSAFGILTEKLAGVFDSAGPAAIKSWELQLTGVKGWRDAQATFGGVALDEIDMETMESTIVPGLYFAGEIIDAQGPCGGFNLQNAWETGIRAAKAMMKTGE